MEVIVQPTKEKAIELSARIMAQQVRVKPNSVLGLATGRTMEPLYDILVDMHKNEGLDFSLCRSFNLDEYVGLPGDDENSYRYYMNDFLFKRINIDIRNTHVPNGVAPDLAVECERYDNLIGEVGGVDLQLLGLGEIGHIGFNEPLSSLRSRTREKALTPHTFAQNSPLFDNPDDMPKRALTMGIGTILDSRKCLMVVTGKKKAGILAKSVEGPVTSMVSASALQLHPSAVVVVDEEAASELTQIDYYRWIFENEPEWEEFR